MAFEAEPGAFDVWVGGDSTCGNGAAFTLA
jgi:hypothetical protein